MKLILFLSAAVRKWLECATFLRQLNIAYATKRLSRPRVKNELYFHQGGPMTVRLKRRFIELRDSRLSAFPE
jgi:hypothetical protein